MFQLCSTTDQLGNFNIFSTWCRSKHWLTLAKAFISLLRRILSLLVSMSVSVLSRESNMYAAFIQKSHGYSNSSSRTASPRPASKQRRRNDVKTNSASSSPSRDRAPSRDQSPLVSANKARSAGLKQSSSNQSLSSVGAAACHVCHDKQSSLINSVARIEICDKLGSAPPSSGPVAAVAMEKPIVSAAAAKTGNGNSSLSSSAVGMSAPEFAQALESVVPPMVLDCRSFISYNLCHVRGAINVGCADRVTKRRLQSGKICVADLIKCPSIKERFLANVNSAFVVYDDDTTDVTDAAASSNNSCGGSSLQLILKSLQSRDIKAHYLKGGLAEFHARYEQLCNKPKPTGATPLYSPTTPIVSNEIDTAVASKVLPFLYVGNERDASNRERLRDLGITHVLNVTSHIPCHFESDAICYKRLKASDSGCQNLKQYFTEASSFIDEVQSSGGKVLVHCQAGVSRSATITVAYIMLHSRMSMMDAFKFVKSCRSIVAPNFNFMGQLMEFEKCLESGNIVRNLGVDLGIQNHGRL